MATATETCPCCDGRVEAHCPGKHCDCVRCKTCGCWGTRDGRRRAKHPKCTR